MSQASSDRPEPGPDADTSAIQDDIERTRRELGDTAQALATKLDVPTQARAKVDETKQQIAKKTEPVRRNAVPIAVSGITAVIVLSLLRRRRRRRRDAAH